MNSSDPAIIKRVEEKYEALDGLEKGGITNLDISLDDMFNITDIVINFLQEFFREFARYGVVKYPSENVTLLVKKINSVAERLEEVP